MSTYGTIVYPLAGPPVDLSQFAPIIRLDIFNTGVSQNFVYTRTFSEYAGLLKGAFIVPVGSLGSTGIVTRYTFAFYESSCSVRFTKNSGINNTFGVYGSFI